MVGYFNVEELSGLNGVGYLGTIKGNGEQSRTDGRDLNDRCKELHHDDGNGSWRTAVAVIFVCRRIGLVVAVLICIILIDILLIDFVTLLDGLTGG